MEMDFKALANKYFEGRIAPEEEKLLLDFISQHPSSLADFRAWEAEWSSRPHFDMATERAWSRFYNWMKLRNNENKIRRGFLRNVSAVIVALAVCSGLVAWYVSTRPADSYYTLTAPVGSKSSLLLPDGSLVWLNAGSTLTYSTGFSVDNRRVKLQGEGYFEVTKHDGAEFVVETDGYDVVVKGTSFNVSAYKDDQYITTILIKGSVLIARGADHLNMKPGDMVQLDTYTGRLTKSRTENDARAWVDNMTEYSDITLSELAKCLSRRYAVNIHVASSRLRKMRFSISLRNKENIDEVLEALQRITAMKICRDGKDIVVSE